VSAAGVRTFVVPGRVELVGKHVDYAGGRSLTCAVDRTITATATELAEPVVRVRDEGKRGLVEAPLAAGIERTLGGKRRGTYVVAVARRFARDFPRARTGVDVTLRSTLPPSAGLSSSSALVVAIASALVAANPSDDDDVWSAIFSDPLARAEYFGAMETGAPFGPCRRRRRRRRARWPPG
jgi:galactokinase